MPGTELTWGIAGYGDIVRRRALPGLLSLSQRVAVVWGRDAARARALAGEHGVPLGTSDYAELLRAVDVVYVATPVAAHVPLAAAAVRAGPPVLVEKPLGLLPLTPAPYGGAPGTGPYGGALGTGPYGGVSARGSGRPPSAPGRRAVSAPSWRRPARTSASPTIGGSPRRSSGWPGCSRAGPCTGSPCPSAPPSPRSPAIRGPGAPTRPRAAGECWPTSAATASTCWSGCWASR
ncbi:hypothetical protein GCM10027187_70080 [Streptosporangium sandarakinum]|uniref:Gfo/Idh/MocA-like oxidoreductase N-terminal domain-containing protein n=1 Tax=Streptosporangium sandarakinum TaxID=1260955 RepID=A0A852UTU8_9ACTN|nr:hypothetical protein [Streptosporangium sandarakinum]